MILSFLESLRRNGNRISVDQNEEATRVYRKGDLVFISGRRASQRALLHVPPPASVPFLETALLEKTEVRHVMAMAA